MIHWHPVRNTMSSSDPRSPHQLAFLMPLKRRDAKSAVTKEGLTASNSGSPRKDDNWRKLLLDRLERTGLTKLDKK